MTMYRNLIFLGVFSLLISINGQPDDERNFPIARYLTSRTSKSSFDAEFSRGRCPQRFFQLGDECLFFATDGKIYSAKHAERICSKRIARVLNDPSSSTIDQPNIQPTNGVRQLVLNTPEKTEILRAIYRDFNDQNFAVRLPSDYNTLPRCSDGKDDKWPQYCSDQQNTNSTCFEAISNGSNDICLREVECNKRYLRLACEFTLPGSSELTNSTFRTCPHVHGRRRRLPMWAWIAIIIASALVLLLIVAGVLGFIRRSKGNQGSKKKSLPEPRQPEDKVIRVSTKRDDAATEPMLTQTTPANVSDTGYLEPRSTLADNTANA